MCKAVGAGDSQYVSCELVSFTRQFTTCKCLLRASSGTAGVSVDLTSMLEYVGTNVADTWESAGDLTLTDVAARWQALVMLCSVGLTALLLLFGTVWLDRITVSEKKKELQKEKDLKKMDFQSVKGTKTGLTSCESESGEILKEEHTPFHPVSLTDMRETVDMSSISDRKCVQYDVTKAKWEKKEEFDPVLLIEQSLPKSFTSDSFQKRFLREVKVFHKWFGIFFHYEESFSRPTRMTMVISHVLQVLFLQAATYDLTQADDGSCGLMILMQECLMEPSAFSRSQAKCVWDVATELCHFRTPDDSNLTIIYIAVVCSVISVPITIVMNWLISNVLTVPTLSRKRTVSVKPATAATAATAASTTARSPRLVNRRAATSLKTVESWIVSSRLQGVFGTNRVVLGTTLETDLANLIADIKRFRDGLPVAERSEFDACWALDTYGEFIADDDSAAVCFSSTHTHARLTFFSVVCGSVVCSVLFEEVILCYTSILLFTALLVM